MKYLVDTDWVVAYLKGRVEGRTLFAALAPDGLAISVITYGEIYEGIYYGSNPLRQERAFQAFLHDVDILLLNEEIMKQFAQIRGALRVTGTIIGDLDTLIAATALHHDLTLVTRNLRHFQRTPGLNLYSL